MHTQSKRSGEGDKVIYRSAYEDREELIKAIGLKEFNSNPAYDDLKDIEIPLGFKYLFNLYIDLYSLCRPDGMSGTIFLTWQDIDSWLRVRNLTLKQSEIGYIIKINQWTQSEISRVRNSEE